MTTIEIPAGFMQDAEGRLVPESVVKPEHKQEDRLVRELIEEALGVSGQLAAFRQRSYQDIQAHLQLVAEQYGVTHGGKKGNVSLTSYDGTLRVQIAVGEFIDFGPELQVAKQLIDECLTNWSDKAPDELKAIVTDAFKVNKEGKLDKDRILGLRRFKFEDGRWQRAMQAISDSVRVTRSKEYIRFYRRPSPDQDFVQIPLALANV
ncbi:Protein of unknown function [Tistlia consotensis]|uniref:Sulfate transporter n=1 Tax=Tistlia consotensis USBA 355 TaxID=560819 RepID=A0A1Y6CSC9_9PROT|nr:DUF3164 family protein [Tistlia consotensis]SMF85863.1 Protein of unknown function [Tistlia consotensis USBA 355]SNS39820.1 Protein of unknown function [Tistlia consotensis]